MTREVRKFCVNCGDPFKGTGELCIDCAPIASKSGQLPPHLHRCLACRETIPIADDYCKTCKAGRAARGVRVQKRLEAAVATIGLCPFCRHDVSWENVRRMERRLPDNVVEAIYYCPHCGALMEFANYIEEKGTGSR